jgi:hypothetical protein
MAWFLVPPVHQNLILLILMYCTMREVIRAIGADKVRTMFFGSLRKTAGS